MKLLLSILLFSTWLSSLSNLDLHDFHLSKCDIIYNVEESAMQISLQLFIDDLELALAASGHEELGICTPKETPEAEKLIYTYITDHLQMNIDGQSLDFTWVGKEVSDDLAGVWCYLEAYRDEAQQSIEVQNDLLMEVFADQRNIVKLVNGADSKAYFMFDKDEKIGTLKIEK